MHATPPGRTEAVPTAADTPASSVVSPVSGGSSEKPPLKKVISINGEEFEADETLEDINIHDLATFEHENFFQTDTFIGSIRRKSAPPRSSARTSHTQVDRDRTRSYPIKKPSFRNVAETVLRTDSILRYLQKYSHRSDSEDTEEEDGGTEEPPKTFRSTVSTVRPGSQSADVPPLDSNRNPTTIAGSKAVSVSSGPHSNPATGPVHVSSGDVHLSLSTTTSGMSPSNHRNGQSAETDGKRKKKSGKRTGQSCNDCVLV